MRLPVEDFRREAWIGDGARCSHTPIVNLHFLQPKLLLRLVLTATSRSTYGTTLSSSRWLFILHGTVVTASLSQSTAPQLIKMAPPASPATSSSSLASSSPEGIDNYCSDFYKETSGSRHRASTFDIIIIISSIVSIISIIIIIGIIIGILGIIIISIIVFIVVIIDRIAGTMVLG